MIPLGAGRECERDTPRREGKLAALAFPSLLRFPPSRSLLPDPFSPEIEAQSSACRIREIIRSFKPQFIRTANIKQRKPDERLTP